ncbi:MAG: sulfatase-like hydrolase/transferase [Planctomycetota bacterium]
MADDMGYECVVANGGETYETPNLDSLAKRAVRFTRGHAQPICTPTRVQIMSGLYNSRSYTVFGELKPGTTTFANILQDAGYATCIVGKWQLRGGFEGPNKFGFDKYCLWQLIRRPNWFSNPGLEINGEEKDFKNGEYGLDLVTDYPNDFIDRQARSGKPFLLYYPMMLLHWSFEPTPDSEEWDPVFR